MRFRFERTWQFAMDVDDLWRVLEDTSSYPQWWPWLREAQLPALERDARARFSVAAPLLYRMRLGLRLTEVTPGQRVVAALDGDLVGRAELRIATAAEGGSRATLEWDLALERPVLRALGSLGRGVLEAGHEWVVRAGVRQFAAAHGIEAREVRVSTGRSAARDGARSPRQIVADGLMAGAVAGVVSGAPSTVVTLARGRSLAESTRAAGTLLGAPTLPRGVVAHGALSLGWGVVISTLVAPRHRLAGRVALGAGAGALIAVLDLGLVARRRFPSIDRLGFPPQLADHVLYGAVAGAALGWRRAPADVVGSGSR